MALKALPKRIGVAAARVRPMIGSGPDRDKRRRQVMPWRKLYDTKRWKELSLAVKRDALFTCQWPGCGRVEADTAKLAADHKVPHHGDEALFFDRANLWCLCKPCHDRHKQAQERGGWKTPHP